MAEEKIFIMATETRGDTMRIYFARKRNEISVDKKGRMMCKALTIHRGFFISGEAGALRDDYQELTAIHQEFLRKALVSNQFRIEENVVVPELNQPT